MLPAAVAIRGEGWVCGALQALHFRVQSRAALGRGAAIRN